MPYIKALQKTALDHSYIQIKTLLHPGRQPQKSFESISEVRFTSVMTTGYCRVLPIEAAHRQRKRNAAVQEAIKIDNRGDFGLWAIEVAKLIVSEEGFELARAARDGSEDDVRVAGNALGQAITNALLEVYDGLVDGAPEE